MTSAPTPTTGSTSQGVDERNKPPEQGGGGSIVYLGCLISVMCWMVAAMWFENYSTAGVSLLLAISLVAHAKNIEFLDEAIALAERSTNGWIESNKYNRRLLEIIKSRMNQ